MATHKLIANRFVINDPDQDLIGQGTMGRVYRGLDKLTGQAIAIKSLKVSSITTDSELVARFIREGEALRQLNHPNIVHMLDLVEEKGQHFLVMEYVQGGSLRDLMDRQSGLPIQNILQIGIELADALTRAHYLNIIHRDLKPANVLLADDGTPRLTDFGVAHVASSPRLTVSGELIGTPHYLSPEACQAEKLDVRTDIWAFGIMLFEMLTNSVPFNGPAIVNVVMGILTEPIPNILDLRSDTPPALVNLIERLLTKERDRRPSSIRIVATELESIMHGRAAGSTAVPGIQPVTKPVPSPIKPEIHISRPKHLRQLHEKLTDAFDDEELRTLCFHLNVDYEDLPGRGRANKARDLISLLERNGRIPQLIEHASQLRPHLIWTLQAHIFISYKRQSQTDSQLASYLHHNLRAQGHRTFIDQIMSTGTAWLEEIDRHLQQSDFLIVLLSKESADSEMVQSEIRRAYDYQRQQGNPHILPIRMAYNGLLPYSIDAFLNPLQYVIWHNEQDNDLVLQEIITTIETGLPDKKPYQLTTSKEQITISEDGRFLTSSTLDHPPLPEFDPRIIEEQLAAPGGAVHIHDKFYIEREADNQIKRQLRRVGTITTIRASRQTGKSSLLVRGIHYARQQGAQIVHLDLQRIDKDDLYSADTFLRYLAKTIVRKLRLESNEVTKAWTSSMGPQDKLTYLMEDYVLPRSEKNIILTMDEVDRLLDTEYHSDFFALIRSWHNSAAYDELWEMLSIIMVISTESYLLIADHNQSPFNVGLKLNLKDFTPEQVEDLNQRHGSPVQDAHFDEFMQLLNGQPYLTRSALYMFVSEKPSWSEFLRLAPLPEGPFSDHLRHQQWLLQDDPELRAAFKQIIRGQQCENEVARYRLLQAGLITSTGNSHNPRCNLYRIFFKDKL